MASKHSFNTYFDEIIIGDSAAFSSDSVDTVSFAKNEPVGLLQFREKKDEGGWIGDLFRFSMGVWRET